MNMHDWVEGRKAGGLPCPHLRRPCKEQYEELAFSLSPIQQVGKYFQIISFREINSFPYVCVSWCIYSGRQGMKSKSIFCGMISLSLFLHPPFIIQSLSFTHTCKYKAGGSFSNIHMRQRARGGGGGPISISQPWEGLYRLLPLPLYVQFHMQWWIHENH